LVSDLRDKKEIVDSGDKKISIETNTSDKNK